MDHTGIEVWQDLPCPVQVGFRFPILSNQTGGEAYIALRATWLRAKPSEIPKPFPASRRPSTRIDEMDFIHVRARCQRAGCLLAGKDGRRQGSFHVDATEYGFRLCLTRSAHGSGYGEAKG